MQAECVELVVIERVPGGKALGAAVAGAPVDGSGYDRRAAGHRAAAVEAPQNGPGRGVKAVHAGAGGRVRARVDHAVRDADGCGVGRAVRIGGLPEDLAGGRIERGEGPGGVRLARIRPGAAERVRLVEGVALGDVDAPAVSRRAVLDAVPGIRRGADVGLPDDLSCGGVDRPVDPTLLADAEQLLPGTWH